MFDFIHLSDRELKYVVIAIVTILSFVGCFSPKLYASRRRCPLGMSSALCFGAGVLFETAILHIYTESQISLPSISPVIFCVTFIFMYAVDEIFHLCFDVYITQDGSHQTTAGSVFKKLKFWKSQSQTHLLPAYDQSSFDSESCGASDLSSINGDNSIDTIVRIGENYPEKCPIGSHKPKSYGTMSRNDNSEDRYDEQPSTSKEMPVLDCQPDDDAKLIYSRSTPSLSSLPQSQVRSERKTSLNLTLLNSGKSEVPMSPNVLSESVLSERDRILERRLSMQQHRQECREYNEVSGIDTYHMNTITLPPPNNSTIGNLGLLLGLSIHSILEGIPIGLEVGNKMLFLTGAIACHKLVIALCLGMELANTGSRWPWIILQSLIFSLTLPGGTILGEMVKNFDDSFDTYIAPIMQSVAGGSILYVALIEVLTRERLRWQNNKTRKAVGIVLLLSFAVGFIVMFSFGSLIGKHTNELRKSISAG